MRVVRGRTHPQQGPQKNRKIQRLPPLILQRSAAKRGSRHLAEHSPATRRHVKGRGRVASFFVGLRLPVAENLCQPAALLLVSGALVCASARLSRPACRVALRLCEHLHVFVLCSLRAPPCRICCIDKLLHRLSWGVLNPLDPLALWVWVCVFVCVCGGGGCFGRRLLSDPQVDEEMQQIWASLKQDIKRNVDRDTAEVGAHPRSAAQRVPSVRCGECSASPGRRPPRLSSNASPVVVPARLWAVNLPVGSCVSAAAAAAAAAAAIPPPLSPASQPNASVFADAGLCQCGRLSRSRGNAEEDYPEDVGACP